ncbi:MAG: flavodoxin domain-containing protein [Actinobacteria bacterium]|nr:flavodoxin domain-containing protein [Actinomycetota bacterium]
MQAVIIYDSLTGNTRRAANDIADELYRFGIGSNLFKVSEVSDAAVAGADLVLVGSWTDGLFVVAQKPGRRRKFKHLLPDLTGKRCAVFCTFALNPGNTLNKLTKLVEAHGGDVVGGMSIRRDDLEGGAAELTQRLVAVLSA